MIDRCILFILLFSPLAHTFDRDAEVKDDGIVSGLLSIVSVRNDSVSIKCAFKSGEKNDCKTCIDKSNDCFFCGGGVNECLRYDWYFPECDIKDVRHKNCWVDWAALIVIVSIIGAVVLVIIIFALCYLCCRVKGWKNKRAKIYWNRKTDKEKQKRTAMEMEQAEKRSQRSKEMDYYREKYGIKKEPVIKKAVELKK